jgi:hypothetical protein
MPAAVLPIRHSSPVSWAEGDITIDLPPLDEVARCWPILEPILKRATDRCRGYEPVDVLQLVMVGQMNLFVVRVGGRIAALAVTQVHQFPRCRVLEVPFIAGTGLKRWWRPLLAALDAQAEMLDCADLAGWDRKGWARYGFEVSGVTLVRRLKG